MRSKSYFLSDLHMFSRRSEAEEHLDAIHDSVSTAHTFVLGGDIFDFRWTRLPSVDHTIEQAVAWLHKLVSSHGRCEFHYVLGNHDCNRAFVRRLDALARRTPNLTWHQYWVRLGNSLFLHGDVADWPMDQSTLSRLRSRGQHDRKRGEISNLAYDVAIGAGLHKLASRVVNRDRRVTRHIHSYLNDIGQNARSGVRHVYFGHTHTPMADFRHEGLSFHNGGAPIKGLEFRILNTHL